MYNSIAYSCINAKQDTMAITVCVLCIRVFTQSESDDAEVYTE